MQSVSKSVIGAKDDSEQPYSILQVEHFVGPLNIKMCDKNKIKIPHWHGLFSASLLPGGLVLHAIYDDQSVTQLFLPG